MIFLIDHNLRGHSLVFFGAIASQNWLDIVPIRFVTFSEVNLSVDSNDRIEVVLDIDNYRGAKRIFIP